MKKAILGILFLTLLASCLLAVNSPRSYYQKVVAGNGSDILAIITNTGTTTNSNYQVRAWMLSRPGEVLQTGVTPLSSLRLVKMGASPNIYAAVVIQLGTFTTQWAMNDELHVEVTYTGAGPYNGQTTSWNYTIPDNSTSPILITPPTSTATQNIPPIAVIPSHDYPTVATNPGPSTGVMDVDPNAVVLSWTCPHDADYTDPVGYRLYLGSDNPPTNVLNGVYVAGGPGTHTYNVPPLAPQTHYFWRVVPTTSAPTKSMPEVRAVLVNRNMLNTSKQEPPVVPTWDFTTGGAGGTPVQVVSNIPGMDIFRNGVNTGFTTPQTFLEDVGATPTYSVEQHPFMVTPPPQTITVGATPIVMTFNYTPGPTSVYNLIVTLTDGSPIVAHFGAGIGQWHVTVDPPDTVTTGMIIFNITTPPDGMEHGFMNVLACIQIWARDTSLLNGTNITIQNANDVVTQVAIHWAREIEGIFPSDSWPTWYPAAGGFTFNGAPGPFPLGSAPFTGSSFTNGDPLNTIVIGPLPPLPTGANALFEACFNNGGDLPVELSSFTAIATAQMFVNLQWITESETNNLGFNVLRNTSNDPATAQRVNGALIAGTNSSEQHTYNFIDEDVVANTTYYYWLEMVSMSGVSQLSSGVTVRVDNHTPPALPTVTTMSKAYPNPFSATRRTQLDVNVKANETATVTVYNILGQAVKTWTVQPGTTTLQWDGKDSKGAALGSGVYFAKMTSPSRTMTTKMVIVK